MSGAAARDLIRNHDLVAARPASGSDGRLVKDDVGGVHQRITFDVEGVGLELEHEYGALAGKDHRLLRDDPFLATCRVRATKLPRLKAAEHGPSSLAKALVIGQILQLARSVLDDLR